MMIEPDADIFSYIMGGDESILLGYMRIIGIQKTSSIQWLWRILKLSRHNLCKLGTLHSNLAFLAHRTL